MRGDFFSRRSHNQGLDSQAVPYQTQFLLGIVPDTEGVHSAEPTGQRINAPGLVPVQQNFGIAMRAEPVALLFEFSPEFQKIVNTAIEHQADRAVLGQHRLVPCGAKIQNRQAAMSQSNPGPFRHPFGIRPAPRQRCHHTSSL